MKPRRWIALVSLAMGASTACLLDPSEDCREDASYTAAPIPPTKTVRLGEITPGSGLTIDPDAGVEAGADAASLVKAIVGTKEEWLAISCEEACRRARAQGLLSQPNVITSCSFETDHGPVLGEGEPWLRCNFTETKCTRYR